MTACRPLSPPELPRHSTVLECSLPGLGQIGESIRYHNAGNSVRSAQVFAEAQTFTSRGTAGCTKVRLAGGGGGGGGDSFFEAFFGGGDFGGEAMGGRGQRRQGASKRVNISVTFEEAAKRVLEAARRA